MAVPHIVARHCGTGQGCQGGMFLAYVSPLLSLDLRCAAAGVPEDRRNYRSKTL